MDTQDTNAPIQAVTLAETSKKSKADIVLRLREIADAAEIVDRHELEGLKQQFYKQRSAELAVQRQAYLEAGGDEATYEPLPDPLEEEFKQAMAIIKQQRSDHFSAIEKEKAENLQKKLAILERLKAICDIPQDASKNYPEVKQIQEEWNAAKLIPAASVNETWKRYSLYIDQYYDSLNLNNAFRDYDFRKNLEIKQRLVEAVEALAKQDDVISAYFQKLKFHEQYQETGPVAKEHRQEVWDRFKEASDIINRRYQDHFEQQKRAEEENLAGKTALCETLEAIDLAAIKSLADWEKKTAEVLAIQTAWKTIGFAPRKVNDKIFERFRAACDAFFAAKQDYFKERKETQNDNLAKKKALCEQAEALLERTDWRNPAARLIKLQKAWRTIGQVPKRMNDAVWKRFLTACDTFFNRQKEAQSQMRAEENSNLAQKKAILAQAAELQKGDAAALSEETIRELLTQWSAVKHVPMKERDRLNKQFDAAVEALYEKLGISPVQRKLASFAQDMANKDTQSLFFQRGKMVTLQENLRKEIQTYENNLGFFNANSKKGANPFAEEINNNIAKLKGDLALVEEKIRWIEEALK